MSLELNLKSKFIAFLLLFCYPATLLADPKVNGELIPPGEAMHVTDPSILNKLNLGPDNESVWCYSDLANSLIITSAEREREKCQLQLSQEKERLQALHKLELDTITVELNSLKKEYVSILSVKDKEIEELTRAAAIRPNDYTAWYAAGGFFTGVATVLAVLWATK